MFAEKLAPFIGKPFKHGGKSLEDGGFDCLGLLKAIYDVLEKPFPNYWEEEGVTEDNYVEYYLKLSREEKEEKLLKFAETFGEEIPIHSVLTRDFVIMKVEYSENECETYPGIYVGNGMVISSFLNNGVTVFPVCETNYIIKVRRL
jgi:cell wall-associated NlpC family hydrolase